MRLLHLSDTHGLHHQLKELPSADVLVHSGDFSHMGTEEEVLDFLNWLIELPYDHKIFVAGNHDSCLWEAEEIEDLPQNIYFLQNRGVTIDGLKFFGLGYDCSEDLIPLDTDILVTHEPPYLILDEAAGRRWGNLPLRDRIFHVSPRYHLFGHAHESFGTLKEKGVVFSNASLMDEMNRLINKPRLFILK